MALIRKPFDPSKFQKSITKSVKGISTGFNDPDTWISTGNYTLNKRISGDFYKGIPLGKVTVFAGESGAGKSYIVSGSIVKHAQEQGIYCVIIDTENALDEKWLNQLGVDTSDDKILRISASMINDVAAIVTGFVDEYKANYMELPREERPKILFVIDSLGMLMSENDVKQFENADMKGDMGIKAKQLKAFMTNVTNMLGDLNIGMVCTNHTYKSQDMFNPDDVVSGGSGPIFSSSIIVAMKKLKLKKDADGVKTSAVHGIRAACTVAKSRYAKPFEKIELEIPYATGLSVHSGLFEFFQSKNMLTKSGNRWQYISKDGTEHKYYEKEYNRNEAGILDLIMKEYSEADEHREQVTVDAEDSTEE